MWSRRGYLAAAVLVVVGVLAFVLQPGPPEGKCVAEGAPSSGFVDSDSGCAISDDSYAEIADYDSSPKPFRIVGLLLVLAGVVTAVVTLVRSRRSGPSGSPAP